MDRHAQDQAAFRSLSGAAEVCDGNSQTPMSVHASTRTSVWKNPPQSPPDPPSTGTGCFTGFLVILSCPELVLFMWVCY